MDIGKRTLGFIFTSTDGQKTVTRYTGEPFSREDDTSYLHVPSIRRYSDYVMPEDPPEQNWNRDSHDDGWRFESSWHERNGRVRLFSVIPSISTLVTQRGIRAGPHEKYSSKFVVALHNIIMSFHGCTSYINGCTSYIHIAVEIPKVNERVSVVKLRINSLKKSS